MAARNHGTKRALPFLELTLRSQKPRKHGLTIVRDRIYPLRIQQDFLNTYAPFVDYAKISNITACLYAETLLKAKIDLYHEHDVIPMFGGLVFEMSYAQGKVDEFLDYVVEKKIAVEISNNIVNVPVSERLAVAEKLSNTGIEVFCEVGKKYPTAPFAVREIATEIEQLHDGGVALVVLEHAEIKAVLGDDCCASTADRLTELFYRIGHEKLLAEVESRQHILYMIKTFGPSVNLGPNIDWPLVPWIEPLRNGVGRELGHTAITQTALDNKIALRTGHEIE